MRRAHGVSLTAPLGQRTAPNVILSTAKDLA